MHHVSLPDPLFNEVERFALASGQSVEAYVTEAVRLRISDDAPVVLTPDQLERCAVAEAEIDAGKGFTSEQIREHFRNRKAAWTPN